MKENDALYRQMLDRARAARLNAYAPYSKFSVGACILTKKGNFYTGANWENAAFGAGTCAERCAISNCIAAGDHEIEAIAITADYAAWPCGICRQALREFCVSTQMPVIVSGYQDNDYTVRTLEELLPNSFGPDALDNII